MKKLLIILFIIINTPIFAASKKEAIRGVWVPAPRFTEVLHSYQNVQKFVQLLDELNFNSIYLVSYAESKTIYQSNVIKQYTNVNDLAATSLLTGHTKNYNQPLKSPTNDPVLDLINLAHAHKIKVFFWYEYGFMGDTKPMTPTHPILANHPDFLGIANNGQPANYHQKDYYLNAYDQKVQKYITDLVLEGIKLYPTVDGIQGDDRMPAMPKNSGYDEFTIQKYKQEHQGKLPPNNFEDKDWVEWRLNLLNDFALQFYKEVKKANKKVMVSFAPNPYPWSKENLMQDWPQWIKSGACDLLAVQCYRYNAEAYKNTVTEVLSYVNKNNPKQLLATGIILMEGGKIKMTQELLKEQININRSLGINNEIYFYNQALNDKALQHFFKEEYSSKVKFPKPKKH